MNQLVLQIIMALIEAFKEYQKQQRLLAQTQKNAEDIKSIDAAFEGDGDAKTLNDIFMHRLSERVSKPTTKAD